jgi:hypothetical protein
MSIYEITIAMQIIVNALLLVTVLNQHATNARYKRHITDNMIALQKAQNFLSRTQKAREANEHG